MLRQLLLSTLLFGVGLGVKAQEGTPRPSFFEEERRLRTPSEVEISSDRKERSEGGFTDTFLTDALGGVGDPGQASESSGSINTTSITPNQTQTPISNVTPPPPPPSSQGVFVTSPLR